MFKLLILNPCRPLYPLTFCRFNCCRLSFCKSLWLTSFWNYVPFTVERQTVLINFLNPPGATKTPFETGKQNVNERFYKILSSLFSAAAQRYTLWRK